MAEGDEEEGEQKEDDLETEQHELDLSLCELSLQSVVGIGSPKTLKMEGSLQGQTVVVLIDTGASHNFIATSLVKKLDLPVRHTKQFGVMVSDGHEVKGMGLCKSVNLEIQGFHLIIDCLPFELGRLDIILDYDWLCTLGKFSINLNFSLLSFRWGSDKVVLRGSSALATTKVSMKSLLSTVKKDGGDCWVLLNVMDSSSGDNVPNCPVELKPILEEFQ